MRERFTISSSHFGRQSFVKLCLSLSDLHELAQVRLQIVLRTAKGSRKSLDVLLLLEPRSQMADAIEESGTSNKRHCS